MFGFLKKKKNESENQSQHPELIGLRLGGSIRFDDLSLKMLEKQAVIEGCAREVLIEAIGIARLDSDLTLVRYYHSDDGFIQVNIHGDLEEQNITDVIAFYFYGDAPGISQDSDWERILKQEVSQASITVEGLNYQRSFEDVGETPPMAFTEEVTETDGDHSRVDQFFMLYNRSLENGEDELMMQVAEEKVNQQQLERSFWRAVGYPLTQSSFTQIS